MHMKYIKFIITSALMISIFFVFTGLSFDHEEEIIKELMTKRTDILESMLNDDISYEEGKRRLREVEEGKLLTDDMQMIERYADTDYDQVAGMNIYDIEKVSHVSDLITYSVSVNWTLSGYDGIYHDRINYYLGIKAKEKEYKIVSMEAVR